MTHVQPSTSNVIAFPYSVSRRVHSRRPRASKNGTPEERASRETAIPAEIVAGYENLPLADRLMISEMVRADLDKREGAPLGGPNLSETGRNEKLRRERSDVWRAVEAKLDYWRAWEKLHSRILHAQRCEVLDDLGISKALLRVHGDFSEPWVFNNELLHRIRAAEIELLLTPAPTVAALTYKKSKLLHPWYRSDANADAEYLRKHIFGSSQSPFRDIEQAIADDEAWLRAHPARQCNANKRRRVSSADE